MITSRYFSILFAVFISTNAWAQSDLPSMFIKNINGTPVSFSSIIDTSKVVVISFWATWCVPCIDELDALQEKLDDSHQPAFELIAISTDEARTVQKVKPMVKSRGWNFGIYLDESNEVKRAFNVSIIPHVLILYKGKLIFQKTGYLPGDEDILLEKIKQVGLNDNE